MQPRCSIIIPALDEAKSLGETLAALDSYREAGCEVIVVDGGSSDETFKLAQSHADVSIRARRGRAAQMNAGAAQARSLLLWFMHADTLPAQSSREVVECLEKSCSGWGFFSLRLSGEQRWCRVIEFFINGRSRWQGVGTGDQGIFCRRALFEAIGGYADIELMEDIELCQQLKRRQAADFIDAYPLQTSSRRWQQRGVVTTVLLMWRLRFAFWIGVNHRKLAEAYR